MKVIDIHNFGDENVPDVLVSGPGLTIEEAEKIVKERNEKRGEYSYYWAIVVEDAYKVSQGFQS